jgi:hypothetical protein
LGQLTRDPGDVTLNTSRYADLILRANLDGQVSEIRARIYRGGHWRCVRDGNAGTIAFHDGKGRYRDAQGRWQDDPGELVYGPCDILSGITGVTNEAIRNQGPTPIGWYRLYERRDFQPDWVGRSRPQVDHILNPQGYLQQGSYCQWSGPGNRAGQGIHGAYQHEGENPPDSIHFKFQLVNWGHNARGRTELQIHPDGFNDGTAGCIGVQTYADCCEIMFLLRHYSGTHIRVQTQ